ncbi:MAG: tRNA adenosine(34) deaminase TadA [Thermodesulfobacteriota bacterium]
MKQDEFFMQLALTEAQDAGRRGEVPVGAALVVDGQLIAKAGNRKESSNDPTSHAEVLVVREAGLKLGSWRLADATVYVTVEPCIMCMGALLLARVRRLVYGCTDPKAGACGSLFDLANDARLNHTIQVTNGVLAARARKLMQEFFKQLRNNSTKITESRPCPESRPVPAS